MSISRTKMLQVSKCLIGLAVMMLQSCDVADNRRDLLCGNWESVEGKPDGSGFDSIKKGCCMQQRWGVEFLSLF